MIIDIAVHRSCICRIASMEYVAKLRGKLLRL